MGRLHTKAADCEYHEYDHRLIEQFINRLDDVVRIGKILRELTVIKDTNDATDNQRLIWPQRLEVHRAQNEVVNHKKEDKEC